MTKYRVSVTVEARSAAEAVAEMVIDEQVNGKS